MTGRKRSRIIDSILLLAANLELEVVAEGIETRDQLEVLRSLGCQYGQGYHLGKPLASSDWAAHLSVHGNVVLPEEDALQL